MTFNYFNNLSPVYMNNVFKPAGQNATATLGFLCLNLGSRCEKPITDKTSLSYVAQSIWNKFPDFLKTAENVKTYKHRVKKHFFHRMNNEESNIYS